MKKLIIFLIIKKAIILSFLLFSNSAISQELILPTSLPDNSEYNKLYVHPSSEPQGLPPADDINILLKEVQPNLITSALAYDSDNLQFNSVKLSNLLTIIYSEILNENYVLSPDLLDDARRVSFRYIKKSHNDFKSFLQEFLNNLDYDIKYINNTAHIISINKKSSEDFDYYVYNTKYRSVSYLVNILKEYFPENFRANSKQIYSSEPIQSDNVNPNSALALIDKEQDILTFRYENDRQKEKILSMISELDTKNENLLVKAYIYEVYNNEKNGSALSLVLSMINDKLRINTVDYTNPLNNLVSFTSNSFALVFSQIETDNRFKLISNPFLRVKNGNEVNLNVGASVPVLGNVSYQDGNAIQSIEYKDTGLTLSIKPEIYKDDISVDLKLEISEVVNTTTGVNNSPTFTKRSLDTSFNSKLNEIIMLGGLANNKNSNDKSRPFFLPFLTSKTSTKENTEIIIFFEITQAEEIRSLPKF